VPKSCAHVSLSGNKRRWPPTKRGELEWKFQRPLSAKAANGSTLKVYNDEQLTHTQYRGGSVIVETITGDGLVVASGALPEREVYTVTFKPGAGEWDGPGRRSRPGRKSARQPICARR
jgi:hypothetical protein